MQTFQCICCGRSIDSLWFDSVTIESPEQGAWNGGVVEKIHMPYGSKHDGEVFVFAICDNCIDEKIENGLIGKRINND